MASNKKQTAALNEIRGTLLGLDRVERNVTRATARVAKARNALRDIARFKGAPPRD